MDLWVVPAGLPSASAAGECAQTLGDGRLPGTSRGCITTAGPSASDRLTPPSSAPLRRHTRRTNGGDEKRTSARVRREADASCVHRVVPSAVPSDAPRVRPMARIRDRCDGPRISKREWRADAVGSTAAGVVVRLVLLLRTTGTARIRDHAGRQEDACKKRPQPDPQAGAAQARSCCPILFCHGRDSGLRRPKRPCLLGSWARGRCRNPLRSGWGFGNAIGNPRGFLQRIRGFRQSRRGYGSGPRSVYLRVARAATTLIAPPDAPGVLRARLDQHERDALRRPRPLARDDQRPDPHIRAMQQLRERPTSPATSPRSRSRSRPSEYALGAPRLAWPAMSPRIDDYLRLPAESN